MPKQIEGGAYLSRMLRLGFGGLLFKEMRLGKTATFIRFAKREKLPGPFLIVCPNTVKKSWVNELRAEFEFDYVELEGDKENKIQPLEKEYKWYIINYESAVPSLNKKPDEKYFRSGIDLEHYLWFAVILDESVKIASSDPSPKSSTSKFFIRYFKHVQLKYCLCGNPCPENELQFINQFIFVFGHFMGYTSQWHFVQANYIQIGFLTLPRVGVKRKIYEYVHEWAYVCTRKEAGIGSKIIEAVRYIGMSSKQKAAYEEMNSKWTYKHIYTKFKLAQRIHLHKLASGFDISTQDNGNKWLSDLKLKELLYLLSTEMKDQQILIWCKFRHEAEYLLQNLSPLYKCRKIDGDTDTATREVYRRDFHAGKYLLQIATIDSLAKGTDWSVASAGIYFSIEDSADNMTQSRDRGIHPKKQDPFYCLYLLTKGTVDEDIYGNVKDKNFNSGFFMSKLYKRVLEGIR